MTTWRKHGYISYPSDRLLTEHIQHFVSSEVVPAHTLLVKVLLTRLPLLILDCQVEQDMLYACRVHPTSASRP